MWHLKTWFSGGRGSAGLMVWLHDLKDFFQPKIFYDSLYHCEKWAREKYLFGLCYGHNPKKLTNEKSKL